MLQEYHLIKHRRNGSTIYQCKHYTHYMKVGSQEMIQSEVDMYSIVHQYGFPLPTLLEYNIEHDDISYMKEESLEGNLFADVFTYDCEQYGEIRKNHFDSFCLYQKNHLYFQLQTQDKALAQTFFDKFEDLYEEGEIDHNIIDQLKEKIVRVTATLPVVRNHGDHNPYNIFTDGLIDLEDSFDGPLGYDTITALTQNYWFPTQGGELNQQHAFTEGQINRYLKYCSRKEIDFMDNDIFAALFIMRGIFATVKTVNFPGLYQFRYKKLLQTITEYLNGNQNMIHYFITHYKTSL
ncbi:hypothetical protein XF24_00772 [candidate division SR1 bacterium Aalborg_AAW-1]|nr:hypothetical protein XF24_00772 [candidate division SR1 bacterium Aalborg_AAW-1]